jgi:hypothetical protein
MPSKPTLHVCHFDRGGTGLHACRRADDALRRDRRVGARERRCGAVTSAAHHGAGS